MRPGYPIFIVPPTGASSGRYEPMSLPARPEGWGDRHPVLMAGSAMLVCVAVSGGALLLAQDNRLTLWMTCVAALGGACLLIATPVLLWTVVEQLVRWHHRQTSPPLSELGISVRLANILRNAGYETIRDVERLDTADLMSLRRVEPQEAAQFARAIALYRYRRWQESGFTTDRP